MAINKCEEFQAEEAILGGFTFTATGTAYSKQYTVGEYNELKGVIKGTWTNNSGATINVTLQMYERATGTWHDHATTFTELTDDGNEDKDFTSFGSTIRFKVVAGGAFGSEEAVTVIIGVIAKEG